MSNIDLPEVQSESTQLELGALFAYLWEGRAIVAATAFLCVVIGQIWYHNTDRLYEASSVLSSAPSNMNAAPSGGVASAARLIGLGGAGGGAVSEFTKFQALLNSSLLADRLAARPNLLQQIFPEHWDAASKRWKPPGGIVASLKNVMGLGSEQAVAPGAQDVLAFLGSVDQNLSLQTGLLTLSLRSSDSQFAQAFLGTVHREADNILRDNARARSARRIAYLHNTLRSLDAVDQRSALIMLLNQEEQNAMMVSSDPSYAAEIVDPPHAPSAPVSPKFSATVVVSLFLGVLLGLLIYVGLRLTGYYGRPFRSGR